MIAKLCLTLSVCLITLLIGCNPKVDSSTQQVITPVSPVVSVPAIGGTILSDPLLPDSITIYCPLFGNGNTVRQFPFSSINQPATTLRLTRVILDGKVIRRYEYNQQGRLAERTDYYTNGIQIYRKFVYSYDVDKLIKIASQLNKEAPYIEGYPQKSDLLPSTVTTYVSTTDSIAWTAKTTVIEFLDWYQKPGTIISRLGFSPTGALIWEDRTNEQGKLSQYTVYQRNELGNAVFCRTGSLFNRWDVSRFRYDEKLNPFRTTGDLQSLDSGLLAGANMTNTNNVLNQSSINSEGGRDNWHYSYEYRPDNYPSRVITYRNGELTGTIEFIYNQ